MGIRVVLSSEECCVETACMAVWCLGAPAQGSVSHLAPVLSWRPLVGRMPRSQAFKEEKFRGKNAEPPQSVSRNLAM